MSSDNIGGSSIGLRSLVIMKKVCVTYIYILGHSPPDVPSVTILPYVIERDVF